MPSQKLPLRVGVGVIILNNKNQVFVGKRKDNPVNKWQMPQGGVDAGENGDFKILERRLQVRRRPGRWHKDKMIARTHPDHENQSKCGNVVKRQDHQRGIALGQTQMSDQGIGLMGIGQDALVA